MSAYVIVASGCDDNTCILIDLTDDEADVVGRVADAITAAGGGCSPTMRITTKDEADQVPES